MNRAVLLLISGAAVVLLGAATASNSPNEPKSASADQSKAIERGAYLVNIMSCNDCHTPWQMGPAGPEPDMTRMLSGHPEGFPATPPPAASETWLGSYTATFTGWSGPWGISYSANLTPDKETGLGEWTAEEFIASVRSGRHRGRGREILPPMPIQSVQHLTDEDLRALFAYLKSIPAVRNKVPEPKAPAGS